MMALWHGNTFRICEKKYYILLHGLLCGNHADKSRRKVLEIYLRSLHNIYSQAFSKECLKTPNITSFTKSKGQQNENQQSMIKI